MNVTIQDMLKAGVHFGHRTRFWNPKMAPYIYGAREKVHIIDLDKTSEQLKESLIFIRKLVSNKGKIIFVGTKRACQETIKEQAKRCGMPYINKRWLGGMMTNYKTIRRSVRRLKDLEKLMSDESRTDSYTKKEILNMQRQLGKMEESLGGIKDMSGLPDALFVIDVKNEKIAIAEANRLGIPVIAIVDTNCTPEGVDYVIPGNDDAIKAIKLYCESVADAVLEGLTKLEQSQYVAEQASQETVVEHKNSSEEDSTVQ